MPTTTTTSTSTIRPATPLCSLPTFESTTIPPASHGAILHIGVGYTGTNKEAGFTLIFRSDGSGTGTLSFSTTFEGKFIPQDPASSWNYIREVSDSLSSTQANKFIKVNAAGNALEYGECRRGLHKPRRHAELRSRDKEGSSWR